MDKPPSERPLRSKEKLRPHELAACLLAATAIIYAVLAGLHTLQDLDLGWQLATGRWVVQHRDIFSTDVFSYAAFGQPWIYPAFSGVLFYLCYLAGGYSLLCWLGAITCAGSIALLLRRNSILQCGLAVIAVPLIANRTQPRAEMFTTILFAAFLAILWKHYRAGRAPLWLLPILMVAWVNLHLGFSSGLALCAGYVLLLAFDSFIPPLKSGANEKLRRAWPWLTATLFATLVNPWGYLIYSALLRQQRAQALHSAWLVEWQDVPLSWASVHQAFDLSDPQSAFWWLLAAVVIAIGAAAWQKRFGASLFLIGATFFALRHVRLQALFACVVVVVAGTLIHESIPKKESSPAQRTRLPLYLTTGFTACLIALAFVRSVDLISSRYYMRTTQPAVFGTGLSFWYPQHAIEFLRREKLPANIFNTYSLGGYLTWQLFPDYRDYIDGRAIPFGPELFFRAYELSVQPPDSPTWQQEASARNINTIIIPLARYSGLNLFPQLQTFCHSKLWRPVYLDEASAIFLRNTNENASLLNRLQIDCSTVLFARAPSEESHRAEAFNSYANTAGVLYSLQRNAEATEAIDRANAIFSGTPHVHLLRALILQETGRPQESEQEFLTSLSIEPTDEAWFDLGLFYMTQKRFADAASIFQRSAQSGVRPHDMWMMLGQADLQLRRPQPALDAFDAAETSSPLANEGAVLGSNFNSLIATGRAKAWYQLGDVEQALKFQEEAVSLAPSDPSLWLGLADLYDVQGRTTKGAEARSRARSLQSNLQ
jgi:tetratricopeptide (TPR) repeat protein